MILNQMNFKRMKIHISEKKWEVTGILLALVFGLFTVYPILFPEHLNITFDIINDVNVLDVHKPLNELNIYFQGEDIQQKNLNLRIISIKIENTGTKNILQNYYDNNVIFGLQIDDGHVIETRLVESNSEYLKSNLNVRTINNTIEFSKPIFENNNYFIVEILVLHDKNKIPLLTPLGKIAGIEKMEIKHSYNETQPLFNVAFLGSTSIQLIRLFGYTYVFIIVALIIILIGDQIDKRRIGLIKNKRTMLVQKLDSKEDLSFQNRILISKILICIPQNKWKEVLNSLRTYKFHRDVLEVSPDDLFDKFCKKYNENYLFNKPIAAYTDDYLPFSTYNTMLAIGSLLFKNKLLGEKSGLENLCYSKVDVQFLKDLSDSIDFLEKFTWVPWSEHLKVDN